MGEDDGMFVLEEVTSSAGSRLSNMDERCTRCLESDADCIRLYCCT